MKERREGRLEGLWRWSEAEQDSGVRDGNCKDEKGGSDGSAVWESWGVSG